MLSPCYVCVWACFRHVMFVFEHVFAMLCVSFSMLSPCYVCVRACFRYVMCVFEHAFAILCVSLSMLSPCYVCIRAYFRHVMCVWACFRRVMCVFEHAFAMLCVFEYTKISIFEPGWDLLWKLRHWRPQQCGSLISYNHNNKRKHLRISEMEETLSLSAVRPRNDVR
jgi:hypothetical protein